jgi:hypothetical protein
MRPFYIAAAYESGLRESLSFAFWRRIVHGYCLPPLANLGAGNETRHIDSPAGCLSSVLAKNDSKSRRRFTDRLPNCLGV